MPPRQLVIGVAAVTITLSLLISPNRWIAGDSDPCPGHSMDACIALCPASPPSAFQACVASCASRCPGAHAVMEPQPTTRQHTGPPAFLSKLPAPAPAPPPVPMLVQHPAYRPSPPGPPSAPVPLPAPPPVPPPLSPPPPPSQASQRAPVAAAAAMAAMAAAEVDPGAGYRVVRTLHLLPAAAAASWGLRAAAAAAAAAGAGQPRPRGAGGGGRCVLRPRLRVPHVRAGAGPAAEQVRVRGPRPEGRRR